MIHLKIIDKDGYTFYGSADKQEFFFGKKRPTILFQKCVSLPRNSSDF